MCLVEMILEAWQWIQIARIKQRAQNRKRNTCLLPLAVRLGSCEFSDVTYRTTVTRIRLSFWSGRAGQSHKSLIQVLYKILTPITQHHGILWCIRYQHLTDTVLERPSVRHEIYSRRFSDITLLREGGEGGNVAVGWDTALPASKSRVSFPKVSHNPSNPR
jgi:hypothetical protein